MTIEYHVPVLLNEVIVYLQVKRGNWYIDATAGGGGHAAEIMKAGGRVLAIDQDQEAIEHLIKKFNQEITTGKILIKEGNFADLETIIKTNQIEKVQGVLFDLGMSTYQIKNSGRGFSFGKDEILDMRMSQKNNISAKDIINSYSQEELYEIFRFFGEENLAGELAKAIVFARSLKPINRTTELVGIAHDVYKKANIRSKINPATKIFQALRIKVNNELDNLKKGLADAIKILNHDGRCVVISFHSLEDRLVKQFYLEQVKSNQGLIVTKKPITAKAEELGINSAARSAKMRVLKKI